MREALGDWIGRYITMNVELLVVLMVLLLAWMAVALPLDAIFGWGIMDATRDLLDPVIPDGGSTDPGDCDPRYGSC